MTLTVKAVDAAKPREKAYKLADAHGLYLYVSPMGAKSWRANYTAAGKQKTRTYGLYPGVSLAEARKAHSARREDAPAPKLAPTFETVMRDWLKAKLPTLSNGKHQIQVANTLERYALPSLGKLPIDAIPRSELVKVVRAAQEGGKIETGHRVASRISAVFDYAQDTGLIEQHGAAGLTRVLVARKTKKPMASIPPEEAGALMRAIDGYDDSVTRLGLLLLAHTFVRVGELRGMLWGELKEGGAVWVVPETRMKMRMPHVVPLSRQAQSILAKLREMSGDGALVLDSPIHPGHPLSENTFLFALYRLGYRGRMTAHGFRALASTVLNERSGFPHDVIERQLAHKETDAVRAAYNRAEYLTQRRELMQWWSDWLECAPSAPALARAA
ncbi:tyrosine-type recombinase/integrase [Variovorax sp. tm]|uniref:tyrosine-type recombinase/integrase n=1 Tax=Variovorax atrisoli TaxID=3394203 RepID=UPI003A7F7BE4